MPAKKEFNLTSVALAVLVPLILGAGSTFLVMRIEMARLTVIVADQQKELNTAITNSVEKVDNRVSAIRDGHNKRLDDIEASQKEYTKRFWKLSGWVKDWLDRTRGEAKLTPPSTDRIDWDR